MTNKNEFIILNSKTNAQYVFDLKASGGKTPQDILADIQSIMKGIKFDHEALSSLVDKSVAIWSIPEYYEDLAMVEDIEKEITEFMDQYPQLWSAVEYSMVVDGRTRISQILSEPNALRSLDTEAFPLAIIIELMRAVYGYSVEEYYEYDMVVDHFITKTDVNV